MKTQFKILIPLTGANAVSNTTLRFKYILKVKYEGIGYDLTGALIPSAGTRKVGLFSPAGLLIFPSDLKFPPNSKVYVLYKV